MKNTKLPDVYFDFQQDFLYPPPTNIFLFHIVWELLKDTPGSTLVDVGCGCGTLIRLIQKRKAFKVIEGIDISEYAIAIANKNFQKSGITANLYLQDVTNLSLKMKYDIVVSTEVIEHVEDDEKMIRNLYNILQDNGTLILTTPREDGRDHKKIDKSYGHLRRYTENAMTDILERNKFQVIEIGSAGFPFHYLFCRIQQFIHRKSDTIKPILTGKKRKLMVLLFPIFYILFKIDILLAKIKFFKKRGITLYVKAKKKVYE